MSNPVLVRAHDFKFEGRREVLQLQLQAPEDLDGDGCSDHWGCLPFITAAWRRRTAGKDGGTSGQAGGEEV